MNISNINGSDAYTANKSATPLVDNSLLENQNREAAKTDPNQKTSRAAQQAFEVNITQEAQNLLTAKTTPPPAQAAADKNTEQDQSPAATQEARQIVNIVA